MVRTKGRFLHPFILRQVKGFWGHRRDEHENPVGGYGGRHHGWHLQPGEKYLSDCRAGDSVTVRRIVRGGPICRRLIEMGFYSGTQVRVVKYAPLKDPLECEIKGYHIALRVSEAQRIVVSANAI